MFSTTGLLGITPFSPSLSFHLSNLGIVFVPRRAKVPPHSNLGVLPCMAGRSHAFTAHQGANEKQYGQRIMDPDLTGHETLLVCLSLLCLPSKLLWHFQSDLSGSGELFCACAAFPSYSTSFPPSEKSRGVSQSTQRLSWGCAAVAQVLLLAWAERQELWESGEKKRVSSMTCRQAISSDMSHCVLARWEYLSLRL